MCPDISVQQQAIKQANQSGQSVQQQAIFFVEFDGQQDPYQLVRWIDDPLGMAQNDPIGQEIFAEWNNVPMAPAFLSEEEINQVIDYIIGPVGRRLGSVVDGVPLESFLYGDDLRPTAWLGPDGELKARFIYREGPGAAIAMATLY